jgi:Ran GTPase-activating protein (RanGAP) involved in mRNA processing and transport
MSHWQSRSNLNRLDSLRRGESKLELEFKQQSVFDSKKAYFEQYRDAQRQNLHNTLTKQPSQYNRASSKESSPQKQPSSMLRHVSYTPQLSGLRTTTRERSQESSMIDPEEISNRLSLRPSSARSKFLNECLSLQIEPPLSLLPIDILSSTTYSVASIPVASDNVAEVLAHSLNGLSHLEYVNIERCNVTDIGLRYLLEAFMSNHSLKGLNISHNQFDEESSEMLIQLIEQSAVLEELVLRGLKIGDEMLYRILEAVKYRNTVKHLDLGENNLGMRALQLYRRSSRTKETQSSVSLDEVNHEEALSNYLALSFCSIQTLILDWNNIRGNRIMTLLKALPMNTSLTHLDLSYNSLGADGGEWLGQAIQLNRSLQEVKIAHNNINSTACFSIMCGLRMNEAMRRIDISDNPLGDIGINAVVRLLIDGRNSEKTIDLRDMSFRIRNYVDCWVEPQLLLSQIGSKEEDIVYDLGQPYERAKCVERLNYLAMNADDSTMIKLKSIFLRIRGRKPEVDTNFGSSVSHTSDEDVSLHLISKPLNDAQSASSSRSSSPISKSAMISFFHASTSPSSSTNDGNFETLFGKLSPRQHQPAVKPGHRSPAASPHATSVNSFSFYHDAILNKATVLFEKYDVNLSKTLSHEKIRLIVSALSKDMGDSVLKNVLSLHDSLECGTVRKDDFLTALSSIIQRLQRSWSYKNCPRYYSNIMPSQNLDSCKRYCIPTSGRAQIIIPPR